VSIAATDAAALCRVLDGDHHEAKERIRAILAERFTPSSDLTRDEYREQVMRWMRMLVDTGETKTMFPREYGGGGDVGAGIAAFELLGHADLSLLVKCGVQFGLFGGAVQHLGNERHRSELLPRIMDLDLIGCFAMTETGHGSNVQALGTVARYDDGELVVDTPDDEARKDYIGNAARDGRLAVVFAQLEVDGEEHGVHALLVPLRDEHGNVLDGVEIEDCGEKLGLEGVDNGRIRFDGVRVPCTALLDRYAKIDEDGRYSSPIENKNRRFFTTIGTLIQGRVSVGGAAISATKSALTIAIRHALRRRQFGPPGEAEVPLLDYRVHQRRLLPALATTYALNFAQREVVAELHRALTADERADREQRQLEALAAGVKATATWHATATIQTCREACGGAGYLAENRFKALKADTDVFTTFEGDNTVLLQLVGKELLTDYKQRFGDLSGLEMIRFVGEQAYETVVERTLARQVATRIADALPGGDGDDADEGDVDDPELQRELFCWREEHMLSSLARRLKRGLDDGGEQFEVFNECQDHLLAAAQAHVDRQVLDAFGRAVDGCDEGPLREVLDRLYRLHALSTIERERGWYFEHGRMTGPRSKAVTRAVNRLCGELRDDAELLVDAFAIPDAALAAPIALARD